jgi:hypothetical protein
MLEEDFTKNLFKEFIENCKWTRRREQGDGPFAHFFISILESLKRYSYKYFLFWKEYDIIYRDWRKWNYEYW